MLIIEDKFIACGETHTPAVNSPYSRKQVPKELFQGNNGKLYVMCLHCRNYKKTKKNERKKREIITKKPMDNEHSYCSYYGHGNIVKSMYPKDHVPIKLFIKNENDPDSKLNINCFDCRMYDKNYMKKYVTEKKQKISSKKKDNTEYSYCPYSLHETTVNSIYPRDRVPIQFFRSDENNHKSQLFENCIDCRTYKNEKANENKNIKKCKVEEKGLYLCGGCHKIVKLEERAFNLDGTLSTSCNACKAKGDSGKQNRIDIKIELIKKNQCSCVKCKCLFLKPDDDSIIVKKILTYEDIEQTGSWCAIYNGKEMLVTDIINLYYKDLELSVIELDHLTEAEQRERGLLLEDEKYIPKKGIMSRINGKNSIKTEILKCQMLCMFCHVEETIKREKGTCRKTLLAKTKYEYIKNFKAQGCESCGYNNTDIPRLFDFDHIDPSNKIASISSMYITSDYSLDDVINECKKCRVLCKFCHRIHSVKQQKERLLSLTMNKSNINTINKHEESEEI